MTTEDVRNLRRIEASSDPVIQAALSIALRSIESQIEERLKITQHVASNGTPPRILSFTSK